MARFSQASSGIFPSVIPGQRMHKNGGDDVDRGSDAAEAGNQQRQSPEVRAVSARKCLRGQRRVGEPSHVRSVAGPIQSVAADKAEIEEQSAEGRHPEAEGVQTRKRHIARADHQGDQIVRESKHHRHGHEENHGRAVHREHPVEHLRRDEIVVRTNELDPHDGRFNSADHEKHQRIKDVQDAQPFVIDGGHPFVECFDERARRSSAAGKAMDSVDIGDLLDVQRFVNLTKRLQICGHCIQVRIAQPHRRHLAIRV